MGPFDILLARIALGERLRKATRDDYRSHFAWLLWFTLFVILALDWASPLLSRASTSVVWLSLTVWGLAGWGFAEFFRRFVPAIVPLVIVITAWTLYFLL